MPLFRSKSSRGNESASRLGWVPLHRRNGRYYDDAGNEVRRSDIRTDTVFNPSQRQWERVPVRQGSAPAPTRRDVRMRAAPPTQPGPDRRPSYTFAQQPRPQSHRASIQHSDPQNRRVRSIPSASSLYSRSESGRTPAPSHRSRRSARPEPSPRDQRFDRQRSRATGVAWSEPPEQPERSNLNFQNWRFGPDGNREVLEGWGERPQSLFPRPAPPERRTSRRPSAAHPVNPYRESSSLYQDRYGSQDNRPPSSYERRNPGVERSVHDRRRPASTRDSIRTTTTQIPRFD